MEEIWLVSQGSGHKTPPILRWWWGFLLLDSVLNMASAFAMRTSEPEPAFFSLLVAITGITTSILLMRIIRRVTEMQLKRHADGPPQAESSTASSLIADLASG